MYSKDADGINLYVLYHICCVSSLVSRRLLSLLLGAFTRISAQNHLKVERSDTGKYFVSNSIRLTAKNRFSIRFDLTI